MHAPQLAFDRRRESTKSSANDHHSKSAACHLAALFPCRAVFVQSGDTLKDTRSVTVGGEALGRRESFLIILSPTLKPVLLYRFPPCLAVTLRTELVDVRNKRLYGG